MRQLIRFILPTLLMIAAWNYSQAFCGFYVAKADASLFNNRSEVILVRDGLRTVITMSSDFKGDVRDFAMVVPVPTVLKEDQIRIVERSIFETLDAYSSPRLVEYYDSNPCYQEVYEENVMYKFANASVQLCAPMSKVNEKSYGVTIEAEYSIDEYDILILSAKESDGLKTWLTDNGYKIPDSASEVLDPYIKSNMKFFVVKVNLEKMQNRGNDYLRPIQISFDSPKFMLPIRLGMANSQGSQDMIVYAFTKQGRVECTNYRTVKMPTDRNIPLFVQARFGEFYKDLFERFYRNEGRNAVMLEYAWNVTPSWGGMKCDPCVGPPPISYDFVNAGVNWAASGQEQVFFTRLHVRYSRDKFPADLSFQVTSNQENYQSRYILTHPATGPFDCDEAQQYLHDLRNRRALEIDELYALTGKNYKESSSYLDEFRSFQKVKEDKRNNVVPPVSGNGDGQNGSDKTDDSPVENPTGSEIPRADPLMDIPVPTSPDPKWWLALTFIGITLSVLIFSKSKSEATT